MRSCFQRIGLRVAIAILPTLILFLAGEVVVRFYYWHLHQGDIRYLLTPLPGYDMGGYGPPTYPVETKSYEKLDGCTNRRTVFLLNSEGARGREWAVEKPPGTFRIFCLGASTTFGVNNTIEATWPAKLQEELHARGLPFVEVLNAGVPSRRLADLSRFLFDRLVLYHPDAILYYEGYNDANPANPVVPVVNEAIGKFHASGFGRTAAYLHYRSMLYTYVVEKVYFLRLARFSDVPRGVSSFREDVRRFVRKIRAQGVTPILVLQVTKAPELQSIRTLGADDRRKMERFLLRAAKETPWVSDDRSFLLRMYRTQIFVEATRQVGVQEAVFVIDPRPAFGRVPQPDVLFCDEIHLKDLGNELLAKEIAGPLADYLAKKR